MIPLIEFVLSAHLLARKGSHQSSRIIEQHVEPLLALQELFSGVSHALEVSQIELQKLGGLSGRLFKARDGIGRSLSVSRGYVNRRPLAEQLQDDLVADSAGTTVTLALGNWREEASRLRTSCLP